MGRPPKPTVYKLLEGNRGKRKLSEDEPKPEPGIPACPAVLVGEARVEWRRITAEMNKIGLLTKLDRGLLATYCRAWGDFVKAVEDIETRGHTLVTAKGAEIRNPYQAVKRQAIETLLATAAHFGFSPSARARLHVPKQQAADPFEDFLKSGSKKA